MTIIQQRISASVFRIACEALIRACAVPEHSIPVARGFAPKSYFPPYDHQKDQP